MKRKITIILLLIITLSLSGLAQYSEWEKDIVRNGISFKKFRYSIHGIDTTGSTGYLDSDQVVFGIPLAKDWVHFSKTWMLELYCLSEDHQLFSRNLPEGTWVLQNSRLQYHTVVFPKDTEIDGKTVRGGGGSTGPRTSFYKSGKLRSCFLKKDTEIDGVPCKGGVLSLVQFHENGLLFSAYLSEDTKIQDYELVKGQKVYLDEKGSLMVEK